MLNLLVNTSRSRGRRSSQCKELSPECPGRTDSEAEYFPVLAAWPIIGRLKARRELVKDTEDGGTLNSMVFMDNKLQKDSRQKRPEIILSG